MLLSHSAFQIPFMELIQSFELNRHILRQLSVATQRREIRENTPVHFRSPKRQLERSTSPGGSLRLTGTFGLEMHVRFIS
jgi:hypothetical protein